MSKIRDFTTSYNQKNILGTVSQSGGIPTGAIIESGSNANGTYVKYADGTLICRMFYSPANVPLVALSGGPVGMLTSAVLTFTAPATFVGNGMDVSMSGVAGDSAAHGWVNGYATGNAVSLVYLTTGTASNRQLYIRLMAIGRWY